jgi:dihydroorotate dehydrogenase (fumarate)
MLKNLKNTLLKAVLALLLTAFSLSIVSAPSTALEGGKSPLQAANETDAIAVNPATDGQADKSRTRFEYQLNSGQPARDSIYVVNTGTSSQEVTLYARDAFAGKKGDFLIQDESQQPKDVGAWVRFEGNKKLYTFTLQPRGYMTIPFDVLTPSDATPGDHVGAIVASAITKGSTVNIVRRVAVRLYARLSGQLKARLDLANVKAETYVNPFNPFASNQVVSYDITNVGNVELAADVAVTTTGPLGLFGGPTDSLRITNLLPGSTRHVSQTVSGAGQLVLSTTSVVYTGLLTSNSVAAQQPRGRVDLASYVFPTGWVAWLVAISATLFGVRFVLKSRNNSKANRGQLEKTD